MSVRATRANVTLVSAARFFAPGWEHHRHRTAGVRTGIGGIARDLAFRLIVPVSPWRSTPPVFFQELPGKGWEVDQRAGDNGSWKSTRAVSLIIGL